MKDNRLTSTSLINQEFDSKQGRVAWLSGQRPIGVYSHRDLDVPYFFGDCGMLSVTVADHNRGEMIFGSLELMEWPVMQETEWQDVTLRTPVYFIQRHTDREVVPYLSQVWIPFSTTCFTVLIVTSYAGT